MTLQRVLEAWLIQGPQPVYHERMKSLLRNQWPALANALDELAAEELRSQVRCAKCRGTGSIQQPVYLGMKEPHKWSLCVDCGGTGWQQ